MIIGDGDKAGVKLTGNFLVHPQSNYLRDHVRKFSRRMLVDVLTSAVRKINLP